MKTEAQGDFVGKLCIFSEERISFEINMNLFDVLTVTKYY